MKPGDDGCIVISLHNDTNPAWIWHQMRLSDRDDHGLTDPEEEVDSTGGEGEGELQDHLEIRAFYDDDADCEWNPDEECKLTSWRKLREYVSMETFAGDGILLDGLRVITVYNRQKAINGFPGWKNINLSPFFATRDEADEAFNRWYGTDYSSGYDEDLLESQTGTQYITYQWRLPEHVGNVIQGDSVDITIEFYAQQARHNGYPENPFVGGDPEFSVDLAPGVDPDGDDYFTG